MEDAAHNQMVSLIWNIADDVLKDVFLRGQYRDVILPMIVLRYGKSLFTENKRKNKALENNTILSLSYGRIIVKKSPDEGLVPAEYSGYQILSPGDIVIRCTDLQNDQKSQRVGIVEVEGIITSAYLGLKVNDGVNCRYIAYWLKNWDATKEIYRYGSGLRQLLSWVDLKYLPIPLPPLPEQKAIVSYLDAETGRIDKAIAAEEKMIALLQERREIVINEAVGGGVDFNAEALRRRGWEVKKVKQCAIIEHGSDPKTEGDIPVYGSGAESFKTCGEFKEGPTVLLGRKGATLHIPHYIEGRFWNVDTAFNVYAKPNLNLRYFYYCATCFDYKRYMSQTTLPSMTQSDYANMPIPLPPLPEQEAIVERLDCETGKIDRAIEVKRRQIELLRERRQIVIDEAVRGEPRRREALQNLMRATAKPDAADADPCKNKGGA